MNWIWTSLENHNLNFVCTNSFGHSSVQFSIFDKFIVSCCLFLFIFSYEAKCSLCVLIELHNLGSELCFGGLFVAARLIHLWYSISQFWILLDGLWILLGSSNIVYKQTNCTYQQQYYIKLLLYVHRIYNI